MLVTHEPLPAGPLETNRHADPDICLFSVSSVATNVIEAIGERNVARRGYIQSTDLEPDWTIEALKPLREISSERVSAVVFKWRCQVKLHDFVRVV